jgi:hypothetical protein
MRLNFAGNSEETIREGIRRIGSAVQTQVGLISRLTASRPDSAHARSEQRPAPTDADESLADVVQLPRREGAARARRRRDG